MKNTTQQLFKRKWTDPVYKWEIPLVLNRLKEEIKNMMTHMRSVIRAFASRFNILLLSSDGTSFGVSKLKRRLQRLVLFMSKCHIVENHMSRLNYIGWTFAL